jgi:hypothetical protein
MAAWVTVRVEEHHVFGICCPAEGCRTEVFEQDVRRMVDSGVLLGAVCDRMSELRSRDYTARAHEYADSFHKRLTDLRQAEDGACDFQQTLRVTLQELDYWMKAPWRLCPRCHVMLQKSHGCNSFSCICGHRFDYGMAPSPCGLSLEEITLIRRAIRWSEKGASFKEAELQISAWSGNASALEQFRRRRADRKVSRIAALLNVTCADAQEIITRAKAGDSEAMARIHEARQTSNFFVEPLSS